MSTDDPILDKTLVCLSAHVHPKWGDRSPMDAFNRLLAKHRKVRPADWREDTHLNIQRSQIRSKMVRRTAAELSVLCQHKGAARNERFTREPVVIAVYRGEELLLDGNHRINFWMQRGDTSLHEVHLHYIDGEVA